MKKISIKTVDGSRFDLPNTENREIDFEGICEGRLLRVPVEGGCKYFVIDNIVSITEKEVDDG